MIHPPPDSQKWPCKPCGVILAPWYCDIDRGPTRRPERAIKAPMPAGDDATHPRRLKPRTRPYFRAVCMIKPRLAVTLGGVVLFGCAHALSDGLCKIVYVRFGAAGDGKPVRDSV